MEANQDTSPISGRVSIANVSQKRLTPSHTLAISATVSLGTSQISGRVSLGTTSKNKKTSSHPITSSTITPVSKNKNKTWQELTRNSDNKLVMMTVEDLGPRRTTRVKHSKNKNKPEEEPEAATSKDEARNNKKTNEILSKETMKKTSPVKTASNLMRQLQTKNSPIMKSLKRLKPRTLSDIAPGPNNSHHKLKKSPRKSVNSKLLVSTCEKFGKSIFDSSSQ